MEEGHGSAGTSPEEGSDDAQRVGAPLLQRQTERVEIVLPGKEKAL